MAQSSSREPSSPASPVCATCGGRGILRQGSDLYSTCLDCLGRGVEPSQADSLRFTPPTSASAAR